MYSNIKNIIITESKQTDKKILVGITTYKFLVSLAFSHHIATLVDGINAGLVKKIHIESDMYITNARNQICKDALELWKKGEITHLLFIDDDMIFPVGTIQKLAERNVPIVSGAYYSRNFQPIAFQLHPIFRLLKELPDKGIIQVDGTGAGCLLIECSILQKMKEKYNNEWWFQNTIEEDNGSGNYYGEDVFFFVRIKEMGIPVMLDCEVQCGHMSNAVIDTNRVKDNKFGNSKRRILVNNKQNSS